MTTPGTSSDYGARRWHVMAWPPLAWLETAIKLAALAIGVFVFVDALGGAFALPGGVALAQMIVLAILSLGLIAAIGDRIIEREIVALVFVFVNNLGHWSMVLALALGVTGHAVALFAALMLAGDLVKLLFIATTRDFTVRDMPRIVLYALTGVYVAGYALIVLLEAFK